MSPRFEPGELLFVHPTKPPFRGDDVLIVTARHGNAYSAMVKRLVRIEDETVTVQQFNPPRSFDLPKKDIYGMHLVVGHYRGR